MSTATRIEDLIRVLMQGTSDKSLQWQATTDENTFRLASKSGNIRLTRSEGFDQEAMEPYLTRMLQILNDKGRVIEEYIPSAPTECNRFDELYAMARRSAYKTDEVINNLLDELRHQLEGKK